MPYASILIPLCLLNILVSLKLNINRDSPRHFLLQNKDNMILVSQSRLILLLALSYRIRESKFPIHYLIRCRLNSYFNSPSRNPIQYTNRSFEM
jgi:hypothetical protein